MLILSCEHAGNRVPPDMTGHLRGAGPLLWTHRAFDLGALALARVLARRLQAPLFVFDITRLVVDANRSEGNPEVFSSFTRRLPEAERRRLLEQIHAPHRARIVRAVRRAHAAKRPVLHVAVHSFAARVGRWVRSTDIGLLYDPRRPLETRIAVRWKDALEQALPGWTIHRNRPYRGWTDGLATWLRGFHAEGSYVGFEIEVSERRLRDRRERVRVARAIARTLAEATGLFQRKSGSPKRSVKTTSSTGRRARRFGKGRSG